MSSNCPKCGAKIREEMSFCPHCGAALKVEQPPAEAAPPEAPYRAEKAEKREKREKEEKERAEKREKTEKREKREAGFIASLVFGLILIFLGFLFYLGLTQSISWSAAGAFFIVIVGIIIIVGAIYAAMMAMRRQPRT